MSQRSSGYKRKVLDYYPTPPEVTAALLGFIDGRPGTIWEPACGQGHMVTALHSRFLVLASDVKIGVDFLKCQKLPDPSIRGIITNPPYNLAPEFCRHALALTRPVKGFVAMLLKIDFDSAGGRADLFRDCPAWSRKIVLTKRIVFFVDKKTGKPKASPSTNHAWFLWSWRHEGEARLSYVP